MKNMKPLFFEHSRIPVWLSKFAPIEINAISFFFFVFGRKELSETSRRHETIHFQQQLELLFVFQWLLYAIFHVVGYIKYRNGREAYYYNLFELEAYANEHDQHYLENRKRYCWIKYRI
jgi:predicted membrane protein